MPEPRPVRGPVYVETAGEWVTADVTPLVSDNVHDVLNLLMTSEFFDTFIELATVDPADHDGHAADRLDFEELQARLVERLTTRVSMTGPQAVSVARRMQTFAEPLVAAEEQAADTLDALRSLAQQDPEGVVMTRREWLLAALQQTDHPITTHEAEQLLARSPWLTSGRNTARKDLRGLSRRGALLAVNADGRRAYLPAPAAAIDEKAAA